MPLTLAKPVPFASPPWSGIGKRIESAMRKALFDHQMLEGVDKLAIALSGGKDSLTLLAMLSAISGRGFPPFELTAINVAGEFSCGAGVGQAFIRRACESLGVPLIICQSKQTLEKLECYSCSRERRSLIFEAAKQQGITHIAFGHHQGDSAETVLLNLLHKGEFAGLLPKIPMHRYGITILRPLIYTSEEEIVSFSKYHQFDRITCQCPIGQNSNRRYIKNLIRSVDDSFPNAGGNLARASLLYGSDKAAREVDDV